jgi:hypothetical protein
MHRRGDHVRRDPPGLEVVEPHVVLPHALREVVQEREARHARLLHPQHRVGGLHMGDGGGRDGVAAFAQLPDERGEVGGRLGRREEHRGTAADAGSRAHGRLDLLPEGLVEGLLLLVEHEAQPDLGPVGLHPLPDQRGGMIADVLRRLEDPARRLLAHTGAAVEHPVHRGHADARRGGDICNGRTLRHAPPRDEGFPSVSCTI